MVVNATDVNSAVRRLVNDADVLTSNATIGTTINEGVGVGRVMSRDLMNLHHVDLPILLAIDGDFGSPIDSLVSLSRCTGGP